MKKIRILEWCPQCHGIPDMAKDNDGLVWLYCKKHGHMAGGMTINKAVDHWNKYVSCVMQ